MNDYVAKPVSPQALVNVLEQWLPEESVAVAKQVPGEPKDTAAGSAQDRDIPVFDKVGMMARLMGDEDFAQKLIGVFLEDIPRQIEVLKRCLEAGDVASAERQAHSIKGASANVGGEALRSVALAMEKAGKTGHLELIGAWLPELRGSVRPSEGSDE